ncbi:ATP-dependent zinc metalloprotease FtsH [bioreactor metagenome]|uniref:ATP-dependent zinc metalloprotease FtsH n=1 Tax=bioreactor metagenome TaxID=1076179 RepID=A0A644WLL5_9ZZZZ
MEANKLDLKNDFLNKQAVLENARKILKQEFIGINEIIDEIIDNVSSWFFLPDLQEKPVVVNLWGLTGVGKTSLVNRLVELLDFEDSFYRFDLGEKEGSFSFRDSLDELCKNNDSSPVIIALDEIQHSRTVSGPFRQEVDNDKNRMIWEMIDSGRIQYVEWKRGLWSFEDLIYKLLHLLKAGVEVEKGVVVNNIELYCNEMKVSVGEGERVLFVPYDEYETILEFAGEQLGLHLKKDVAKILLSFSANDTILFLNKVLKIGKRPSIKNFTKSLIFVLGNLDEAYTMSDNFSADIDADEFNKLSKKITVPKIKKALQNRFRNEQIARLGNIHIIYPALDKLSYQIIIDNELKKYAKNLTNTFKIGVVFDNSINDIIYNEGVYPTQGVRPIFTSIHQVLKSKISFFYSVIFLKTMDIDSLHFSARNKKLACEYRKKQQNVYSLETDITTTLENVRQTIKDDLQAITAVHESGHTVLSIVLMKTIPDVVYSITTDADSQGFVYSSFAWKYISRKELIPRVAMMLGGYVAEELIFGKENLTSGASSDIEKATEFLSTMYKNNGMGQTPIKYSIPIKEENDSYHQFGAVEEEIKNAIEEAKLLAEKTLKSEQKLLLSLADFLSDNRMLRKNDIKRFVEKAISNNVDFIEDGDYLFYREHLKKQIKNFQVSKTSEYHFENVISLNKKYKD